MLNYAVERRSTPEVERFLDDSLNCHSICLETVRHCLQMDGRRADAPFRLLLDCAEISQTCATLLPRGADLDGRLYIVSAEVADACASACERFGDDAQMRACAEVCRRTAQSARGVANLTLAS